ncbi:MAG TPA: winged helix-turn-helix domain-containing protein, partial [Terriglobia bacterium]|nr:winged helix-turn-helix domain-containing protein [Terriglobia bacterium]
MSGAGTAGRKVRFGVFELDPQTGELRKGGLRIRLQEQPLRVLVSLLERPGELVTREELRKKLWPDDTFVDFDQGLGTAIRKLREALSDSADNPRFIETLPRRGFRFIAPVNGYAGAAVAGPAVPSQTLEPSARQKSFRRRAVLVAGVLLGVGALAFLLRPSLPSPSVSRITQLTNDRRPKFGFIVADSARLYFTEEIGGHFTPVAVSTKGGEAIPIPAPVQEAVVLDISRDGSELLMIQLGEAEGPIWAVPVSGAPARRLGDLEVGEARWSPDGQEILYLKANDPHLYVAQRDGTDSRALVKVPGNPYDIQWSPDGTRISVSVDDGKSNMLWEVSADGTNLHPVLPDWNFPLASCSGSWTF